MKAANGVWHDGGPTPGEPLRVFQLWVKSVRRAGRSAGGRWANAPIAAGELAVFEESGGVIDFEANDDTSFVLGSAIKHPYPLVLGRYSVHTNRAALARGHAEIDRIGQRLVAEGRL